MKKERHSMTGGGETFSVTEYMPISAKKKLKKARMKSSANTRKKACRITRRGGSARVSMGTREQIIDAGYEPRKSCIPWRVAK